MSEFDTPFHDDQSIAGGPLDDQSMDPSDPGLESDPAIEDPSGGSVDESGGELTTSFPVAGHDELTAAGVPGAEELWGGDVDLDNWLDEAPLWSDSEEEFVPDEADAELAAELGRSADAALEGIDQESLMKSALKRALGEESPEGSA